MAVSNSAVISLLLLFLSISSPSVHGNFTACKDVILYMTDCLSFVTIGSKVEKPEASCCSGLKKVIDANASCLCEGLKNSASFGVKLNVTKASTLPDVCKVNAPPVSKCGLSPTPPATAPAPVPAGPRPAPASAPVPAPAPGPSEKNHGSSLISTSGFSFLISGALVMLFSRF